MFFAGGEHWKRIRSLVTPTFTASRLRKGLYMTKKCVKRVTHNLTDAAETGRQVDLKKLFGAYTLGQYSAV